MATIIRRGFDENWEDSDKTVDSSKLVFIHQNDSNLNEKIDRLFPESEVVVDDWTNIGGKGAGPGGPVIEPFFEMIGYSLKVVGIIYGSSIIAELGKRTIDGIVKIFSKSHRSLCVLTLQNKKKDSSAKVFIPNKISPKELSNLFKKLDKVLYKKNSTSEFVYEPKSNNLIEIYHW